MKIYLLKFYYGNFAEFSNEIAIQICQLCNKFFSKSFRFLNVGAFGRGMQYGKARGIDGR